MDKLSNSEELIDIKVAEVTEDTNIIETIEIIDVTEEEMYTIESDYAFPAIGEPNAQLRHALMTGRELEDQHPITAITGLREELDEIESLKSVYSNIRNRADYYLWEDKNILQEYRVCKFVSLCEDANTIKLSTVDDNVFGVTVDNAGFIGGQNNIPRDISYGLIVSSGVVAVQCESDVTVGDYVVSNNHGFAQKTDNVGGYKVIALVGNDGISCAVIVLGDNMGSMHSLVGEVDTLTNRVDDHETNIVAAMNMATKAHNLATNIENVAADATKKSESALEKSETALDKVEQNESSIGAANEAAVQAKAIAESAIVNAESIRNDAVSKANDAWAKSESVASEFQSLTAKIDQYSVGEYSQAYGLTLEQAASILETGMIYVPTKHLDKNSHSEIYPYTDDDGNEQSITYYFTPGNYYEWNGSIWVEYSESVVFFNEEPMPSGALKYWYIDSNDAPDGYEPHALYAWNEDKWEKVNVLSGNVNNRAISMIRQTTNEISIQVANTRESVATFDARISAAEATVNTTAQWVKGADTDGEKLYNVATIQQAADDDGSSLALVVADKDGNKILKGASIILGQSDDTSSISFNADYINFEGASNFNKNTSISSDGVITTQNVIATGGEIGGWTIDAGILKYGDLGSSGSAFMSTEATDSIKIGGHTGTDWVFGAGNTFGVTGSGKMYCTGGKIGGWTIDDYGFKYEHGDNTVNISGLSSDVFTVYDAAKGGYVFRLGCTGQMTASKVDISGKINATSGSIGRWSIENESYLHSSFGDTSISLNPISNIVFDINDASFGTHFRVYNNGESLMRLNSNNYIWIYGNDGGSKLLLASDDGQMIGQWYGAVSEATTSDMNKKNTISCLDDRYNVLFDNITSRTFKYNDGTSGRLHTGFIAQEVKEALDTAKLDTPEFGGLVIKNNSDGTQDWYLRYEEFISLNTWQIQKLKERVAELEKKLGE